MNLPRLALVPLLPILLLLSACAGLRAGPDEVVLPLQPAWFEGRQVHYVTTDVSDAAMARMMGANHVPRLADALPEGPQRPGRRSAVERAYKFPGGEQATVFPSSPKPVGGDNADASYSPLWVLTEVRWQPGKPPRTLRSEEALLAAEQAGEVLLTPTRVVVNCPVVRDGTQALRGVR